MAQEPVKLHRPNPLRVVGVVAGVVVLGVAVWWGSTSHRVPPAVVTASPPVVAAVPAIAAPSFDIVRVNPQGNAVIAGRAAPGSEVSVRQNGQEIGRAKADQQGQFVVLPDKPLAPGAQELTLSARSGDQPAVNASAPVIVVMPATAPTAAPAPPPATPLVILTPPNAAPQILQAPTQAGPTSARPGLALSIVDYDAAGAIRFSGTADPASPIRIYVDNRLLGQVNTDADGRWVLGPTDAVSTGDHVLRLDQLAANGGVAARVEVPFRRVLASEVPIAGAQTVVVQPGESLWRIATRLYGTGVHYTDIYQANLSQIRNPDLIFPGQVFATPAAAGLEAGRPAAAGLGAARPASSNSSK